MLSTTMFPSQPRRIRLMKCSQPVIVVMPGQIVKKGERRQSSQGAGRRMVQSGYGKRLRHMTRRHTFIHQWVTMQGATCSCINTFTHTQMGPQPPDSRGACIRMNNVVIIHFRDILHARLLSL